MYMRSRVQEKIQAIALRMQGYSYSQIQEQIPVSKGLLSGWLKYIKLTDQQEKDLLIKIQQRSRNGVAKAVASNIKKRKEREVDAYKEAEVIYSKHRTDPIFIAGVCLYWAEGSKRSSGLQFMNSDPELIVFMLFWLQKYLSIRKEDIRLRINTHADFSDEKYEEFWSEKTGIPLTQFMKTIYKPNRHGAYKKNPDYKGCVGLTARGGMALLRKVISLYHILNSEMKMLYSTGH
jgi:transposase